MKNDSRIERIRQQLDYATEGTWHVSENGLLIESDILLFDNPVAKAKFKKDAEFIVNAHQDVSWLISEIDRLNSGIDSVIYDLRNEDTNDPYVLDQVIQNLVTVLNGK